MASRLFRHIVPADVTPLTASIGFGLALAGAIGSVVVAPATADALRADVTSVSCSLTTACVVGTNASTGQGVQGTSAKGTGLSGNSTSGYGVYGTSKSGVGVKAVSSSSSAIFASNSSSSYATINAQQAGSGAALSGTSNSGPGVAAVSTNGNALTATATSGFAILAKSSSAPAISGQSTSNDGVSGIANSGNGLYGSGTSGNGAFTYSDTGYGLESVSTSGTALYAANSSQGTGIVATAVSGLGVSVRSSNGNGLDAAGSYIGIIGRAPASGGFPFVATDSNGHDLFYVDGAGNVYSHGTLHTFAHTVKGDVRTYGASATTPTVEDVGSSALQAGTIRIALDPAFARSIEGTGAYHVFLTPGGDTRGLFVAERDPAGFVVRETQGGRSFVAFDYRIVATTAGNARERAAFVDASVMPRAAVPLHVLATSTAATKIPNAIVPTRPLR